MSVQTACLWQIKMVILAVPFLLLEYYSITPELYSSSRYRTCLTDVVDPSVQVTGGSTLTILYPLQKGMTCLHDQEELFSAAVIPILGMTYYYLTR